MAMSLGLTDFMSFFSLAVAILSLIISLKALFTAMEARADAIGVQRSTHTIVPGVSLDSKLAQEREALEKEAQKFLDPEGVGAGSWFENVLPDDDETKEEAEKKKKKVNG